MQTLTGNTADSLSDTLNVAEGVRYATFEYCCSKRRNHFAEVQPDDGLLCELDSVELICAYSINY